MSFKKFAFNGEKKLNLDSLPTDSGDARSEKDELIKKTEHNLEKIGLLQERLYADGREGLIILLQAMDAAGKDSTVKHVMSGINPQGVDVYSFKQPNSDELSHDFLWRVNRCIPARGKIALFNRSYYEDVLVVQVHKLNKTYKMAERILNEKDSSFFQKRYQHIKHYEEYLYDNSYRIIKIFLNVSAETQKKRFLERIDTPEKNWKFSSSDLKERTFWNDYHKTYEEVINATATENCPWYVIPADQKWYTRYLVSEILLSVLEDMDPHFPEMPPEEKENLTKFREELSSM